MNERRSSIIAIKNPTNPRKYLVYYDPQWEFLLSPTMPQEITRMRGACDLSMPIVSIDVQFISSGTEIKYATAHKEERSYEYYFYAGVVCGIDTNDFTVDGHAYRWMTIEELLADPNTYTHNRYIVERVGRDC